MEVRDYNGEGVWTKNEIIHRYMQYCRKLAISKPIDLSPKEHIEGEVKWVYPVMDKVIDGIEQGDEACKRIGIEFIEENQKFVFGKILKSNTARALRRCYLTDEAQSRTLLNFGVLCARVNSIVKNLDKYSLKNARL